VVVPKKRGRPAGKVSKSNKATSKYKSYKLSTECDGEDYVMPKTYKFLGYCPGLSCNALIMPLDLVIKTIFVCPKCQKRDKVSKLKKSLDNAEQVSKKEFLKGSTVWNSWGE